MWHLVYVKIRMCHQSQEGKTGRLTTRFWAEERSFAEECSLQLHNSPERRETAAGADHLAARRAHETGKDVARSDEGLVG